MSQIDNQPDYGVIEIGYDTLVLPLESAIEIVRAVAKSEKLEGYGDDRKITPFSSGKFNLSVMSSDAYNMLKARAVLLDNNSDDE